MKNIYFLILLAISPWPTQAETVKVCATNWHPYSIENNDGEITSGSSFEIHAEAFRRMKVDFTIESLPWKRCVIEVRKGNIHALLDADPSAYADLIFSAHPTIYNEVAVFVRKEFPEKHYDPVRLKGKKVALPAGYGSYISAAKKNGWIIDEAQDEENVIRMLLGKRLDYALLDLASVRGLKIKLDIDVKRLNPLAIQQKLSTGFLPKNRKLVEKYDQAISDMIEEGFMDDVFKKYFLFSYSEMLSIHY
ncbi:MAG: polar amino acid transport system substrate-binding protein [Oceanicoccus sp.]|jgi:polar amino acid transport system substrate-binding protein